MHAGGRFLALLSTSLLLHTLSADGGVSSPSPSAPGAKTQMFVVTIENVQFSPATLRVHVGDTVKWVNNDLFPHTVSADGKVFDSHDIAPGASWSYRATKSGDFAYSCIYHPTMKGQLSVQ
jgi:plastocyanin